MKLLNKLAAFTLTSSCILGISFQASAGDYSYALQLYSLVTEGASVNMPSISDLTAPYPDYTGGHVIADLWVYPGQSKCNFADPADTCEWIEFGKFKGGAGNFNGQSGDTSPLTGVFNYAGHFYAYNRCTDKCRYYQVNFNGNIPDGRNTYEITYSSGTWYLLLDGKYIQDLPQFGQIPSAQYVFYGIEEYLNGTNFSFNSGIQDTNITIKDTSGVYRTVCNNLLSGDYGPAGIHSSFNNDSTITFTHN